MVYRAAAVGPSRYQRLLPLHLAAAIAWGVIAQWPWGGSLLPALAVLAVLHLAGPFWARLIARIDPMHRAFLLGPMGLFAIDLGALAFAWHTDLWSDLTVVFVPILIGAGFLTLLYAAVVMSLLGRGDKRASRR